jgi:hypothetical protein
MGKKSRSGSGICDEQPGSYFRELINNFLGLKILSFFDADPNPESGIFLTPGSGMEKLRSGIRDKHLGSPTLIFYLLTSAAISYETSYRRRS